MRSKRRQAVEDMQRLERTYRELKRELRSEISKAKLSAWQELLDLIEEDPWGLPYKIVLRKLRRSTPSLTETLETTTVNTLMDSLFPRGVEHDPDAEWHDVAVEWLDEYAVLPRRLRRLSGGRGEG